MATCMKSELDLFREKPLQSNILKTIEQQYKPINSLVNSNVIEFVSLSNAQNYRDMSSAFLRLRLKLYKDDKDTTHTDSKIAPINSVATSLFKSASVSLNNKNIEHNTNYAYRAYIENLLNYGPECASVHLESCCWDLDDPKNMEDGTATLNHGAKERAEMFGKSQEVELMTKLHLDLATTNKLILPNVDIRITLGLSSPDFYIMSSSTEKSYIKILDCTLYMNHVLVAEPILLAHRTVLQKKNAIYEYNRVELKTFTLAKDSTTISLPNIILGPVPRCLIVGLVDSSAFAGTRILNPYNFQHFNISSVSLEVNGQRVPNDPIQFKYTDKDFPISTRAYERLIHGVNLHLLDRAMQITKRHFDNGSTLLAFDLTNDQTVQESSCTSPVENGIISLDMVFAKPLKQAVTAIIYLDNFGTIEIDKFFNIYQTR